MKVRERVGAFLISNKNRLFLFRFHLSPAMSMEDKSIWITPGGGVENGETYEAALSRELQEELGLDITIDKKYIFERKKIVKDLNGIEYLSDEKYFIVKINQENVKHDNMTDDEKIYMKNGKWWTLGDIESSQEFFFIEDLSRILKEILQKAYS